MKLAALTSGGKDSILAIQKALDAGHTVTHMITVVPENKESYMFHSANLAAVRVMAERAGMEYREIPTAGEKEAEILDMQEGIRGLDTEGLIVGAIASTYQRERVEAVCKALGLSVFAPLWGNGTVCRCCRSCIPHGCKNRCDRRRRSRRKCSRQKN
ncbi:MAG: diphthine--ammonia ligase [Methanocorpusculum sp.]|nr:diphthine--ammonia ligase [Methanocorpusculum sp.]